MYKTQVIITLLYYFLSIFLKPVTSEWIELPQFSDKIKVYRTSSIKFNEKKVSNRPNVFKDPLLSIANYTNCNSDEIYTDAPLNSSASTAFDQSNDTHDYKYNNDLKTTIESFIEDETSKVSENKTNEFKNEATYSIMESYTTTKSSILKITEENPKPNRHQQSTIDSLLSYIPINQLNRVHKILLENRGKGFEEKLRFLKSFEKKLLKIISSVVPEITSRTAVIPARKKRGSSWDDNDTHIGFPSLEGALLAISFLTFAIYLIRLIMMLLKNLGNNATTPNTILVNRNKRFATKLTEETIRIHNYLHEFDANIKQ